ncbi:phosphohydrolase [Paralcaligenes sp. KSB-10]|uniref:phosphonate degradation HD-domain oxygenase n=1 Tax=Paralcaligenes sp. KSB-10 TaxID=2901142 RepID=UPI001E549EEF|nr:phosphonate degradation HD-domain oxygenase [Paralcaligenes sp. KSB-10]UHL63714.1 phosphohydrolase [Paralcaligenes sp. KSB-10]
MALSLADIRSLFQEYGSSLYSGEAVTQLEHALQTASLAEREGASKALIAASLLHDLGHILCLLQAASAQPKLGTDDLHQFYALPFLQSTLPDAVLDPIKLHVDAKRCLCAIDNGYYSTLSPASVQSLRLQGGVFNAADAENFLQRPFAQDALRLRRWDDKAKIPDAATPDLEHFLAIVADVQMAHA